MTRPVILWLRQDLRLADHPALYAAIATGKPIIPLYINDKTDGMRPLGLATCWWLHHSLKDLAARYQALGAQLILKQGKALDCLKDLIAATGADTVFWSRCYEPYAIARDTEIKTQLISDGLNVESFNSALLFEPWVIKNKTGQPYQVFTPYWKACLASAEQPAPSLPLPKVIKGYKNRLISDTLEDWGWLPTKPDWAGGLREAWTVGEAGAQHQLQLFLETALKGYKEDRNLPYRQTTSRLSPYLHFGEMSVRQIWHAVQPALFSPEATDAAHFLSELGWREFAHHLLYHFPTLPTEPLNKRFNAFPWGRNDAYENAWQRGRTGYPIVDAGLRELWTTGWMHNRVRMIVGSFLVKDLLLPWQAGEDWFWDTLVDADLANNCASWQWIGGCGADAAPYFRIFNPILQGEKFDPEGDYVRKWCPELKNMPSEYIHKPWQAPALILHAAGVRLGQNYPHPIVDHDKARDAAIAAYSTIKASG